MSDTIDTVEAATAADVRAWARKNSITVGTRGHIAQSTIDEFNRRHRKRKFANTHPAANRG